MSTQSPGFAKSEDKVMRIFIHSTVALKLLSNTDKTGGNEEEEENKTLSNKKNNTKTRETTIEARYKLILRQSSSAQHVERESMFFFQSFRIFLLCGFWQRKQQQKRIFKPSGIFVVVVS